MNYKKVIFLPVFLSSFFVLAETSSESAPSYKKTNSQQQMLLNRESSLLLKIEKLELIKSNTQNPLLYKKTINNLEPLYKEIEVIQKMQILLAQNNKNNLQASEDWLSITKKDIASKISSETDLSKSESELLLNKTISLLVNNLKNKYIKISGLGSFKKFTSPSRPGRNPKTGQEYLIPKKERIRFNVSKLIKDQIN